MTTAVLGIRGPGIHQLFELDDADVAAATGEGGWAMLYEEGAVIEWDANAPLSPDWVVPGYYIPPELTTPVEPPEPTPPEPVAIAFISNEAPAKVHVAVAEMSKFKTGDTVTVVGAVGDFAAANGAHTVGAVDNIIGCFELVGVDTSAAAVPSTTTGMTVTPAAPAAARS